MALLYPNIESERARLVLTQAELVKLLGVGIKTLYSWQRGEHEMPVSKLIQLGEIFDCSLDYLVGISKVRKENGDSIDVNAILSPHIARLVVYDTVVYDNLKTSQKAGEI